MYRRLLVPLDGSQLAEAVVPLIETLAGTPDASVILVHILERDAPVVIHGERHLRAVTEADRYLQDLADRLRQHGIRVEYHAHDAPEGDVARSIAQHAEETGADLIVLSTHGVGGVRHRLFGAIAQHVLSLGTTPVLLARPPGDGAALPFHPRVVLLPLDGTAAAEAALTPAEEVARFLGARMHLVMVVATQDTLAGDRPVASLFPSATRAALDMEEEDACGYLEELADHLRGDGLTVTTEVRRGKLADTLIEEAGEPGVGLVVLATHGRAGVQAIWAGSVTAQLLARTSAPVLLLRRVED